MERIPETIVDEAIAWLIKLEINTPTTAEKNQFNDWLKRSSVHQLAWQRIKRFDDSFTNMPVQALSKAFNKLEETRHTNSLDRRQALKLLSLLSIGTTSSWLAYSYSPWQRLISDLATAVGEQKSVVLAEGSELVLNTDTAVSTDVNRGFRQVFLHRGEIQLDTQTDFASSQAPWLITSSFGEIKCYGAKIIVRLSEQYARINLLHGEVEVANRSQSKLIKAGTDSVILSKQNILQQTNSSVPADAWVQGYVASNSLYLGDLLDELARYRIGRIDYDPTLKNILLSGVFQLLDTDKTLEFLTQIIPIRVEFLTRFWVRIKPD